MLNVKDFGSLVPPCEKQKLQQEYKSSSSNQTATDGEKTWGGKPRKRQTDGMRKDLGTLEVTNWEN